MSKWRVSPYETLPPQAARLCDHRDPQQKIPTPVDSRGLVIVPELIDQVKATVDPEYQWAGKIDVHHFYWKEADYPYNFTPGEANPGAFRNLPIHKGLVFRSFHGWLELITEQPEPPEPEVMLYRMEAWNVAKNLFHTVRETVRTERLAKRRRQFIKENPHVIDQGFNGVDRIAEEVMADVFERNFRGLEYHREQNEKIPAEHRIIELDTGPDEIARNLGRVIVPRSLNILPALRVA